MPRIAVIEDDEPTSRQLRGWIEAARPGIEVHQWRTRDEAEAAIARERYDAVVLDIELVRERHAGVALINAINKRGDGGGAGGQHEPAQPAVGEGGLQGFGQGLQVHRGSPRGR